MNTLTIQKERVRFYRNGQPQPDTQNSLAALAWYATRGMKRGGNTRLGAEALRNTLRKLGVENPDEPGWEVVLRNGETIGCWPEANYRPLSRRTLPRKRPIGERRKQTHLRLLSMGWIRQHVGALDRRAS
jgi:hypothetical protein